MPQQCEHFPCDRTPLTFAGTAIPDLHVIESTLSKEDLSHTKTQSLKFIYYGGEWGHWNTFHDDAVRFVHDVVGRNHAQVGWAEDLSKGIAPLQLRREVLTCGDEEKMTGRFMNNALVPAKDAYQQVLRAAHRTENVVVGDCRVSRMQQDDQNKDDEPNEADPDIVFYNSACIPRCVGELKTHWTIQNLREYKKEFERGERRQPFGRILAVLTQVLLLEGQVGLYMKRFQVRYGFISTYKETVAIRAVPVGKDKWRLELSDVIPSCAYSQRTSYYNQQARYHHITNGVRREDCTTKEAMLYLMLKAGLATHEGSGLGNSWNGDKSWIKNMKRELPPDSDSSKPGPSNFGSSKSSKHMKPSGNSSGAGPSDTHEHQSRSYYTTYRGSPDRPSKFINRTGPEGLEIWDFKYSDRKHKKLEFFNPYLGEWVDRKLSDLEKYCQLSLDKRYGYYKLYSGQVGRSVWLQEVTSTRR